MRKISCITSLLFLLFLSAKTNATPWSFELAPYIWAINMNGTVSVGSQTSHIDETFSDLLKQLNVAGMLYATAHKDNLGLYVNTIYASLSDSNKIDNISIKVKNKFGITGAGLSYILFTHEWLHDKKIILEPYAGFRYTFNNTTLDIDSLSFRKNVNWIDPVIGLQLNYDLNKRWGTQLVGDIGGTNISTHNSYSAAAFVKYQSDSWQHLKTYIGYRLLSQHYETGSSNNYYDWNVKLFGPIIGLGFTF